MDTNEEPAPREFFPGLSRMMTQIAADLRRGSAEAAADGPENWGSRPHIFEAGPSASPPPVPSGESTDGESAWGSLGILEGSDRLGEESSDRVSDLQRSARPGLYPPLSAHAGRRAVPGERLPPELLMSSSASAILVPTSSSGRESLADRLTRRRVDYALRNGGAIKPSGSFIGSSFTDIFSAMADRRQLQVAEFGSSEWVFRNTVSFWVGVFFVEGSILFIVGAAASAFMHGAAKWKFQALVGYPYFVGSLTYTAGAYMGYYEVINVGRADRRLFGCTGATPAGFWGTTLYLIGALCFNVCCAATFVSPDTPEGEKLVSVWMEGVAGTVGSLLFVLAALIEWAHNADATPRQRVFWLCSSYFLGSVLFLVGSGSTLVFGVCECARPELTIWWIDFPYCAGAVLFLFGAWVTTRMWKAEQFGLAFMNEINNFAPTAPNSRTPEDATQKAATAVYMAFAAVSLLDFCSLSAWHAHEIGGVHHPIIFSEEFLTTTTNFVAAHSLLLLVTVVHRSPAVSPYKYLMWLMQLVALLYLSSITLRWLKYFTDPRYFTDTPSDHEPEVEGGLWEQKEALEAGSGVEFTFRE
mmetsp:Transcript_23179/g.72874  ORF Transcript_23179/g.72874 Transcript_23179/m.72874 type:complete len:584 (-) Transcript_23179:64-1815(-)